MRVFVKSKYSCHVSLYIKMLLYALFYYLLLILNKWVDHFLYSAWYWRFVGYSFRWRNIHREWWDKYFGNFLRIAWWYQKNRSCSTEADSFVWSKWRFYSEFHFKYECSSLTLTHYAELQCQIENPPTRWICYQA